MRHPIAMFDTKELLQALKAKGLTQAEIGRAMGLPSSRIAEIFGGKRQIKLDEAKRLVDTFGLEDSALDAGGVNEGAARLLVLHIAHQVGVSLSPNDERVPELAADVQAFLRFVRRRSDHPSPESTEAFLEGLTSAHHSRH